MDPVFEGIVPLDPKKERWRYCFVFLFCFCAGLYVCVFFNGFFCCFAVFHCPLFVLFFPFWLAACVFWMCQQFVCVFMA